MKAPKITKKQREEAFKNQIELLHEIVKLKLGQSIIHGVGVLALRDIKKGEKLYTDIIPHQLDLPYSKFKKLAPEIRDTLLHQFPQIVNGSHFLYPVTKFSAYLNHSETPNYDAIKDEALEDIKEGEEVTEDYRLIDGYKQIYPWIE